ncbi:hypothetical protein HYT01_03035 [Candidatus Giovannonibacteria bacterium]|nr:hypothetical protein [Candidatus Giovannonibacteria bacterium]
MTQYTWKMFITSSVFWTILAYPVFAGAPIVTTNPASFISENDATLNGYADANGGTNMVTWFEYGESSGSMTNSTFRNPYMPTGSGPNVAIARNLNRNTVYYFRIVAQNSDSGSAGAAYGSTLNFKTGPNPTSGSTGTGSGSTGSSGSTGTSNQPTGNSGLIPVTSPGATTQTIKPIAVTNPAKSVLKESAILTGVALPGISTPTEGWFEWGPSTDLQNKTDSENIGSKTTIDFDQKLTRLLPNTSYYFRAAIRNQYGIAYGSTFSFKTGPDAVASTEPVPATSPPFSSALPSPTGAGAKITGNSGTASDASKIRATSTTAAVAFSGDLLPHSLGGWLVLIFLLLAAFLTGWHMRRIYEKRQREKENLERLKNIRS